MTTMSIAEAAIRLFAEQCDWIDVNQPLDLAYANTERHCYVERDTWFPEANLRAAMPKATYIGRRSYCLGGGMMAPKMIIGRFASISHRVNIGSTDHRMDFLSTGRFPGMPEDALEDLPPDGESREFTSIGCDAWLGVNVTVLRGRTIGHGACVGAGSVVTRDIPPYAVAAGNPARVIRMRFPEATVQRLLAARWWMLPDTVLETLPYQNVDACLDRLEKIVPRLR